MHISIHTYPKLSIADYPYEPPPWNGQRSAASEEILGPLVEE